MTTINDLMSNEELLKGLVEVKTATELGELFAKNNVELDDSLTLEEAFEMVKKNEDAELSEEDLEAANGGIALAVAAGSVGCFVLAGATVCFLSGYAYQKYYKGR